MGAKPRQFGMDEQEVRGAASSLNALRHIEVLGFHAYMGTRFLDHRDVVANTQNILETAEGLAAELAVDLSFVDVGGGLGVAYFENESELDTTELGKHLHGLVDDFRARHPDCRIVMELGRFLTADAGTYVTRALYVKESMGESSVIADGGTNHHMAAVGAISRRPCRPTTSPSSWC